MEFKPNDEKIKEISDHLSSLPPENQRLLFITSFILSEDVYYHTNVSRDGKKGNVELLARKDRPMSEKEMGVACLESAAALFMEASNHLGVSLDELTVYLHLIVDRMIRGEYE